MEATKGLSTQSTWYRQEKAEEATPWAYRRLTGFANKVRCISTRQSMFTKWLYQSLLYALLVAVGADVHAEQQTSDGRMDISLKMSDAIYILEFKYAKTQEEALEQVKKKDYAVVFASDPRPVYAVPMNVDAKKRTIEKPIVERLK